MGNNTVYAGFGQGEADSFSNGDYDAWTIGGLHSMSKRTTVYAGYTTHDCDSSASDFKLCDTDEDSTDIFTVGMKHKF